MRINPHSLPLKYYLEIYQEMPNYPTHTDLEYALVSTLADKKLLGKEFLPERIWDGMRTHISSFEALETFLEGLTVAGPNTNIILEKNGIKYKLIEAPWLHK